MFLLEFLNKYHQSNRAVCKSWQNCSAGNIRKKIDNDRRPSALSICLGGFSAARVCSAGNGIYTNLEHHWAMDTRCDRMEWVFFLLFTATTGRDPTGQKIGRLENKVCETNDLFEAYNTRLRKYCALRTIFGY